MFNVGDYVIYGSHGVCRITAVGPMDMAGTSKDRLYYTLCPIYVQGSTVYTPVDNTKVVMRPVVSRSAALELIDRVPGIESLWQTDEKSMEQVYKNAIGTCECTDLIKIIKTLNIRKQSRLDDGKKVTSVDERYLRIAEDLLYGELAIPLQMEKAEVITFLASYMNQKEPTLG